MARTVTVFGAFLVGTILPAASGPWGFAECPSGRIPLTDATVPADATNVVFAAGLVKPGRLSLADRKLGFTAADEGTTVAVDDGQNAFSLSGESGDWTFRGVTFRGNGGDADVVSDGGAIWCRGGRLTLEGCTFADLGSSFAGGAVCACLMDGDVVLADCTFEDNAAGPLNGLGGALYCSRSTTGTGTLIVTGCAFAGNTAENGGAVSTVRALSDDECPMPAALDGCAFVGNASGYNGGAIASEGALSVTNTLFENNVAAVYGGAIVAGTSDPEWTGADIELLAGTAFRGNWATNSIADGRWWSAGGAIAVAEAGYRLSVSGRHVIFEDNRADANSTAYGGAVFAAAGTVADIACAAFLANRADSAGGAVFSCGDRLGLFTSIFSNNVVTADSGFGGAVSVESGASLVMSNATVRGSNRNAVDVYRSTAELVNCLVADNGAEADISVGADAALAADHSAYGRMEAAEGTAVSTNDCLSGIGASAYSGSSLYLDGGRFNPVAELGLVQDALDYDGVAYGSSPGGSAMGAYECTCPKGDPEIEIVSATWYHDRVEGLYYPRIEMRVAGGVPDRLVGVALNCGGVDHELPAADVERLRTAAAGTVIAFGVNPETFVQYPNSPANAGFVPPEDRLFGVYDATRPLAFSLTVQGVPRVAEVVTVPKRMRAMTVVQLSNTVPVPARFAEFRIGERLSGRIESGWAGARVILFGCTALGAEWTSVGELEVDERGEFSRAVPEGMRFFRVEAEVAR